MARYNKRDYSLSNALSNIGDYFWRLYKDDLKAYAEDRKRTDIVNRIHQEWDNPPQLKPTGTDIRIEWALAIYDHGDWEKSQTHPIPSYKNAPPSFCSVDPRRKYPADYRCDNGIYVRSISELCIANWLYFNRIPFEYERQVTFSHESSPAHCDFYLPEKDVYIEFWGMSKDAAYIQYKQWKEPLYAKNNYKLLSLYPYDLKNLSGRFYNALNKIVPPIAAKKPSCETPAEKSTLSTYAEKKVGEIAQTELRHVLESGRLTQTEIALLQKEEYSKDNFDIQYPLLQKATTSKRPTHYYANPVVIAGEKYFVCCEWYENAANNDKPHLIKWIRRHEDIQ